MSQVEEFAAKNELSNITALLQRGALVAQNPREFESVPGLTETERNALEREVTHKWSQPFAMYYTVILCSIGAAVSDAQPNLHISRSLIASQVQGWDQEGSNGANLSWPEQFGVADTAGTPNAAAHSWLIGLVNSGPYIGSAFLGCWLSDPLNNFFGRRGTIFFSAVFCFLSVIGSACTQNWWEFFICRLLLGVGMGSKASTVPIFAAENVPAAVRGGLVMGWQMWTAFGIFLGVTANLAVGKVRMIRTLTKYTVANSNLRSVQSPGVYRSDQPSFQLYRYSSASFSALNHLDGMLFPFQLEVQMC